MNTAFDEITGEVSYRKEVTSLQLKEDIELMLEAALKDRDGTKPMDEMAWAYNQGAIDQLEWVLKREQMGGADIKKLTEGANDSTIKRVEDFKTMLETC